MCVVIPRRPYAFLLAQLNLFLAPVVAALVLVSALLAAPLLSLFTLPLYFLTYPRPARFWPGPVGHNATVSPDSVLYQQVTSLGIRNKPSPRFHSYGEHLLEHFHT